MIAKIIVFFFVLSSIIILLDKKDNFKLKILKIFEILKHYSIYLTCIIGIILYCFYILVFYIYLIETNIKIPQDFGSDLKIFNLGVVIFVLFIFLENTLNKKIEDIVKEEEEKR